MLNKVNATSQMLLVLRAENDMPATCVTRESNRLALSAGSSTSCVTCSQSFYLSEP